MNNNNSGVICFFCLALFSGAISSCDTAQTIADPSRNYFIKYYGGDGDQEGVDVVVDADGSFYLLGNTISNASTNGKQLYLVKTDAEGIIVWEKVFGGKFDDEAKDIELSTDNRLVVLANSKKGSTENDVLLMTFNLDGVRVDSALVGLKTITNEEADDVAGSISQTTDGFIISGTTTRVVSKGTDGVVVAEDVRDAFHLRFTNNITIFDEGPWTRTWGTSGTDGASKVYQVNASTYYVFGYSNINTTSVGAVTGDFNFWVYQLGVAGLPSNNQMYPGALITDEILTSVIIPSPQSVDGFLLVGVSSDNLGNLDVYINKLRKNLTFNKLVDYQVDKPLSISLGKPDLEKRIVSAHASSSGYLLLANEKSLTTNNFYLTKIDSEGKKIVWNDPPFLTFGGQNNDYVGGVTELPDGKIILIGTMSIGDEGQKKMALIKVNQEGKFRE